MIATTYSRGHKTLQYAGHLFAIRCALLRNVYIIYAQLPLITQIREPVRLFYYTYCLLISLP